MTADEIVNLLLEADGKVGPPSDTSGVWAFGPGLPDQGAAFGDLSHMLEALERYGLYRPKVHGEDGLDDLIQRGFTIIQKKHQADVQVYSVKLPLKVTPEIAERVMAYLGLEKGSRVSHKTSYEDGRGETIKAEYLLYGSKELENAEQANAEKEVSQDKEKRLVYYRDRSGRLQAVDPEEEGFHPRPQPTVGTVTRPQEARGSLGLTYDAGYDKMAANEQEKGVMVAAVHDGGPLAQAGVQAGDIIQTASYVDDSGQQKEYRIRTVPNLTAMLATVDPNSPVILYVRRGGQGHEVVVELQRPQTQGALHIPAAEVQASAGQPQAAPKAAQAQAQQPPLRQQPTTRQQNLRGWPRGRRPQPNLPFRPNAEPRSSQTGNQPPNVSTLT